jgi:hypothetical protein
MASHITEAYATNVEGKIKISNLEKNYGQKVHTRKKPHVIYVALGLSYKHK